MWWDGDSDSASLNPAMNAAMLLARYAPIASTTEKTHSYLVRLIFPFTCRVSAHPSHLDNGTNSN